MQSSIGARTPRQTIRILALLVESGVLYILIGVSSALVPHKHESSRILWFLSLQIMTLASPFISGRLPSGALGDIFMPVAVQLAVCNRF
jgi:hypothetical protein